MAYIGKEPANSFISFEKQVFTIVNSQTAYTLSHAVTNENDIRLVINNVIQEPGSGKAYTASGTTLTLSAALVNGTDEMYCVYLGRALQTVNAPDGSISNSQVAPTIITGQTAETTIATDDTILIHDTSASALRKMTRANFVSGIGGTNTPAFHAYLSSAQSIPNTTQTLIAFDTEAFDSAGAYNTSTYKFTPQTAGKYVVYAQMTPNSGDDYDTFELQMYKNAVSTDGTQAICRGRNEAHDTKYINRIVEFNGSTDFVFMYTYQDSSASRNIRGTKYDTFFGAYKIIE